MSRAKAGTGAARILRCEWHRLRGESTVRWLLLLFAVLLALGTVSGVRHQQAMRSRSDAAGEDTVRRQKQMREIGARLEADRAKLPEDVRRRRMPAYNATMLSRGLFPSTALPPTGATFLALGQSDIYPAAFQARFRFEQEAMPDDLANPLILLSGQFDLSFVLVYLYPLFLLALLYDFLTYDREQGTLRLTLSQPVSMPRYVAARIVSRGAPIVAFALLVPAVTAGIMIGGSVFTDFEAAARLAIAAVSVTAYGCFWVAAATMVNLCQTRSSTNALVLSGIYLSVCLVIPALASLALTIWHPLPSRTALLHTLRAARDRNESHQKAVLAEYWKSHPAERPAPGNTHPDDFQTAFFAAHDATDREIRPVAAAFMERQSERTRRAAALRYLSPAMLLQDALSDAAGTGEARYQTFLEQVEEFRSKWRAFFAPQVYRQTPVPPEEWRRVPRFTFREEPLNAVLARVGGSVLAIVIGTTALAALAACTFRSFRLDD